MAPELFEGKGYDEKVDVYSYGMMLWEIAAREHPYGGKAGPRVVRRILTN